MERFALMLDVPAQIIAGVPDRAFQDAAARALHAEITKPGAWAWLRALASRELGTAGNWATFGGFLLAKVKEAAAAYAMAQAQNVTPGAPPPPPPGAAQTPGMENPFEGVRP